MKPTSENYDQAMMQTVNPLFNMDDDELLSRFKLQDNTTAKFKEYRQELLYRLRRSYITNWRAPERWADTPVTDMVVKHPEADDGHQ